MKIFTVCITLLLVSLSTAQTKAITEYGDQVILYENGSWKFVDKKNHSNLPSQKNPKKLSKKSENSFLVKSSKIDLGVWINPKKWSFEKKDPSDAAEYMFELKDSDLMAMMITERAKMSLLALKLAAIKNARAAAPDIEVLNEEFIIINGVKVLSMQMRGTIDGISFTYYGYYYTSDKGAVQLLAFTSSNLFDEYEKEIELFLNGMSKFK